MDNLPQPLKINQQIKDYIIYKELGRGCFGIVYQAINKTTQNEVAIKCVNQQLKFTQKKAYELFQAEVQVLSKMQNDNIVKFIDYFEQDQVSFLVIEYCNEGDVENYIQHKKNKRIPFEEAIQFFKQILNGFKSFHEFNIIHRDLKLANLLLHNGQVKIGDLGFAKEMKDEKALTGTVLGTPLTMAPEVLEQMAYGIECDIYSLGVIFYQMVFGAYPFNGRSEANLLSNIQAQNINFNVQGVLINNEYESLIRAMLKFNRFQRIKWPEIFSHSLFQNKIFDIIGLPNLYQSKIRLDKQISNNQFYDDQKQFQNNQEYNNQIQAQEQKIQEFQKQQQQQQMEEEQTNNNKQQQQQQQQQQQNDLIQQKQLRDLKNTDIKDCSLRYLNEINIFNYIGQSAYYAHELPNTKINTFFPIFFMLKKTNYGYQQIIKSIENRENKFNSAYPEDFFNSDCCKNLLLELRSSAEIIETYYSARKSDMESILSKRPNQEITQELEVVPTQNFENLYSQSLMQYVSSLQKEVQNHSHQKGQDCEKFQKHLYDILDCLLIKQIFRQTDIFNFNEYRSFKMQLNFQTRNNEIDQKLVMFTLQKQ